MEYVNPFQKRPAYRYLRVSDRIPRSIETRDPVALVKLFDPNGRGSWYVAAYDPETQVASGAACITDFEHGDFSMQELGDYRGRFGLPLERDLHWRPRPLSECEGS